ncbi:hypothetical protein B0H11DRAFT_2079264 [Mycena galericulata]|nr:hypothetical protein B0H11DRAFT_2079264 [Mycena galericulata]
MPPRTRGRRSQAAERDSERSTVQLPQELIDAIIDEFDISLQDKDNPTLYPDRNTLRACALVSRAFVGPSQRQLFSTVTLGANGYYGAPPDERSRSFSKILSSKPHIGSYVKNLILSYRSARSKSVETILSSLPKLKTLSLDPRHDRKYHQTIPFPVHLRDSFIAAFSLVSLRRLEIRRHDFTDARDLDSILSNSLGLEELCLINVRFTDNSSQALRIGSDSPRVSLRSLGLFAMQTADMKAVMNTFTAVDVTHLRSISSDGFFEPLLHLNAPSLRELICIRSTWFHATDPLGPVLPANKVDTLTIRIPSATEVTRTIRQLGNLQALKRVSIMAKHVVGDSGEWLKIDSLLADAGAALEDVHVCLDLPTYIRQTVFVEAAVRSDLPALNAKGILRITSTPETSEPRYTV